MYAEIREQIKPQVKYFKGYLSSTIHFEPT